MQNSYAQNNEDIFVLNYFGDYKGTVLEIGANDGVTLSNSRLLIENGWSATLFEPGITCIDLFKLHTGNKKVKVYNFGIGDKDEFVDFWESDEHVPGGKDKGLVSTTNFEETKRWPNVKFTKKGIQLIPFSDLVKENEQFDFISIDAESMDWKILQQIDLEKVGCKALCIEWNSDPKLKELFVNYCKGYILAVVNAENLIFTKMSIIERMKPLLDEIDKNQHKIRAAVNKVKNKPKIGIGVTTDEDCKWKGNLFIGDNDYSVKVGNSTIARDKNWLIKNLYDNGADYIFCFDSDTFPIKKGWEQFFIDASIRTGIQHFVLCNPEHNVKVGYMDDVSLYETGTGCMLFLTRKCIETVGYINPAYGKYGFEHAAYSWRIYRAGLTPYWYPSLNGWEEYIYSWDLDKEHSETHGFTKVQGMSNEEKQACIDLNRPIFDEEMANSKLYYDFAIKSTD